MEKNRLECFFILILWINIELMILGVMWKGLGSLWIGVFYVLVVGVTKFIRET